MMVAWVMCSLGSMAMGADEAIPAAADKPALGVNISAAFMSKYIWRGQLLNDDYVFQPSAGLSYGNWSASLWGNMDLTEYHKDGGGNDNKGEFTEYDWTVGYTDKVPGVDILKYSFGAIYYYFPSLTDDGDTLEIYAGFGLDMPLSPTITIYRDIDEGDCTYVTAGVGHSVEKIFELSSDMSVSMTASASVGWGNESYNKFYWDPDQVNETGSSLQDLTISIGFPVPIMGWTFTPSVSYVTLLDSDIRKTDAYSNGSIAGHSTNKTGSDYIFTGLTLSKSF